MSDQNLRVAVIGAGGIGRYHIELWQRVPTATVVGVYDQGDDAIARVRADFPDLRAFATFEDALADNQVDAIDVCTPNMFHRPCVIAALEAGKHCLCEKPLGATADDIRAMIAARDRSGKLLMTAQQLRFDETTRIARRLVEAGRLGKVYFTRAWWLRRRRAPTTPGFLRTEQAGHGVGLDLGVHLLDLALHLLGQPQPTSVAGFTATEIGQQTEMANEWGVFDPVDFEVDELAGGLVRFADGSVLALEVSWLLNRREQETRRIWLFGNKGGLIWPDLELSHVQDGVQIDSRVASPTRDGGYEAELTAFATAALENAPSPVPAEESLTVARILEGLYKSAESGTEIRLET